MYELLREGLYVSWAEIGMSGKHDPNLPPGVYRNADDLPRNPDGTIDATNILGPKDAEPPETLRDRFAMAALTAIAAPLAEQDRASDFIATMAYILADAMLTERRIK